ncbi:MAG: hypothetical protein ACD_2C00131G0001 [uncultured bacterium (gcode 4)]|uniref:Uncharacterized protein n=1 Tax=uncultured bacterium (gcode 4) TaxID=1234023 RepID=K2FEL7_9BACT|nr:MAG: hypothetical protein ACD_2C00131G0001 [uncultured bacterium (gcode 4)]
MPTFPKSRMKMAIEGSKLQINLTLYGKRLSYLPIGR